VTGLIIITGIIIWYAQGSKICIRF